MTVAVLNNFSTRHYDADVGRFTTSDPHPGILSNSLTINNRYIYALNNGVNRIDPNGKLSFKQSLGVALIAIFPSVGLKFLNLSNAFEKNFDFDATLKSRVNNVAVAAAVIGTAFAKDPVIAGVAQGVTALQNRNKKGNFFDNLDDFTLDFAFNFGITYLFQGGEDIDPNAKSKLLEFVGIGGTELELVIGAGLGGVAAKETLCNNTRHIPHGIIGDILNFYASDRGKEVCD